MVNGAGPIDPPAPLSADRRHLSDLRVAGVLSRRTFGVRSARSLARSAGVSPTTVARALRRLQRDGVVVRRVDQVAEGEVRAVTVWTIDWRSPAWLGIAGDVGRLLAGPTGEHTAPAPPASIRSATRPSRRSRRVPERLAHLFWNADLDRVDARAHGPYVASRILRADDCQALGWLARALHPDAIRAAAAGRGLDPRRAALALLLAGT